MGSGSPMDGSEASAIEGYQATVSTVLTDMEAGSRDQTKDHRKSKVRGKSW